MRDILMPFALRCRKPDTWPRYGEVNDRCMAAAIDLMLMYLLLSGITNYLSLKIFAAYEMSPVGFGAHVQNFAELGEAMWAIRYPWLITNGLVVLMMGIILVACQMAYATTPGKYLLGLKIVRNETLEPVERWRYVVRFVGYLLGGVPLMLGVIWMNFNKKRRGLHDYMAGTVVINTRPRGWYWKQLGRGWRKLRGKPEPLALEETMGEPAAEQRHQDSSKPVE